MVVVYCQKAWSSLQWTELSKGLSRLKMRLVHYWTTWTKTKVYPSWRTAHPHHLQLRIKQQTWWSSKHATFIPKGQESSACCEPNSKLHQTSPTVRRARLEHRIVTLGLSWLIGIAVVRFVHNSRDNECSEYLMQRDLAGENGSTVHTVSCTQWAFLQQRLFTSQDHSWRILVAEPAGTELSEIEPKLWIWKCFTRRRVVWQIA